MRQLEEGPSFTFPPRPRGRPGRKSSEKAAYSLDQIRGQQAAKRALLIALAGGHNLFLTGPRGVGKSMLAQAAAELLPDLSGELLLEVASLRSLSGQSMTGLFDRRPPFRSPHHTVSAATVLGGGTDLLPGELSLAHGGILFLDEFPEFRRDVIEALRQPLQERVVRLQRSGQESVFPAGCITIAAQNSCPCGLLGGKQKRCKCLPGEIRSYQHKISQAVLDRFDLFCELSPLGPHDQASPVANDFEQAIRRVKNSRPLLNAVAPQEAIDVRLTRTPMITRLLAQSQEKYLLSGRGMSRLLRVAATIADLAESEKITTEHLGEALQYRQNLAIP